MTQFYLFASSADSLNLEPEYDFKDKYTRSQSLTRSSDGTGFLYIFGFYRAFDIPVNYKSETYKNKVVQWWADNEALMYLEEGGTVRNVRIVNNTVPLNQRAMPYSDLFKGVIELEEF